MGKLAVEVMDKYLLRAWWDGFFWGYGLGCAFAVGGFLFLGWLLPYPVINGRSEGGRGG